MPEAGQGQGLGALPAPGVEDLELLGTQQRRWILSWRLTSSWRTASRTLPRPFVQFVTPGANRSSPSTARHRIALGPAT
jgi:hypothetical protein